MKVKNISRYSITIREKEGRYMVDLKPGQTKDFTGERPATLAILRRYVERGILEWEE